MKKPANIVEFAATLLRNAASKYSILAAEYDTAYRNGWRFYVVNQQRGRCYYNAKIITIPLWTYKENHDKEYRLYYLAHELAHIAAGWENDHNQVFMRELKRICPAHLVHYELGYKPRNAAAAGITQPIKSFTDKGIIQL